MLSKVKISVFLIISTSIFLFTLPLFAGLSLPSGSCAPTVAGPTTTGVCGDVNNNSSVNQSDLDDLKKHLGILPGAPSKFEPSQADVNPDEDGTSGTAFPPIIDIGDYFTLYNKIYGTPSLKPVSCQASRTDRQAPFVRGISYTSTCYLASGPCEPWHIRSWDSVVFYVTASDSCYSPSSGVAAVEATFDIPGQGSLTYTFGKSNNTENWFSPSISTGSGYDGMSIKILSIKTTDGAGNSFTFLPTYSDFYRDLFNNSTILIYAPIG